MISRKKSIPKSGEALSKYADLTFDTAFKRAMGNKMVLIAFLNTFLIREGEPKITDLEYRNSEHRERRDHAKDSKTHFILFLCALRAYFGYSVF